MSNTFNNNNDNYFSLLGLPISFAIDKERLVDNYHDIQKSIHPDKFANASELERRLSVQKAAQINDALETLKNPTQRSIYLLSLFDVELGENTSGVEPAFLMEQMELRENLSLVDDKDDPLDALDAIIDDVKSRITITMNALENLFNELLSSVELSSAELSSAKLSSEKQRDELLNKAKAQVLKMQFLNRLQEECLNKEEDLADQL